MHLTTNMVFNLVNVISFLVQSFFDMTIFWTKNTYLDRVLSFGHNGYNVIFGYSHVLFC